MRAKIIYILKHNKVFQFLYRKVFSLIFKIIGLFVSTDENLVIFISFMGTKFNDSPKDIFDYLQSHSEYQHLKCIWAFEKPEQYPQLNTVKIDSLQFFIYSLKAKYWISNTQFERGLSFKKKNTKYMYTSHGAGFKLSGNSCPGRKDFDYGSVDFLCVESEYEKMIFRTSFKAKESSFIECGRPGSDILWNCTQEDYYLFRKKLNIPDDKKVILYAPTWRDSINQGKTYDIAPPIDFKKWEKELKDEYIILFRAHHITTNILGVRFNDFVRNVSDYSNVNELMIASDILISDYSSMITDYAVLERPIFSFAYDYDDYLKSRGTYVEIDEVLPNKSCRTEDELLDRIKTIDYERECANTKRFKADFAQYGGNAVEESVKAMFG